MKYHWCIGANGRAYLYSIDWIPGPTAGREGLNTCAHVTDRLAAACDGRAAMPAYLRNPILSIHPGAPEPLRAALSVPYAVCRRDGLAARNLPLPDT